MTDLDTEEPLSGLSDSFVILGQGSLPPTSCDVPSKEPVLNSLGSGKGSLSGLESMSTTTKSNFQLSGSVFSEEGIQRKLNELVRENYQLKETLSQNNLAIKSQLDTFFVWQQEVLKTHESHKQKFLETKELILKLRAENSNLKQQLEDCLASVPFENNVDIYAEVKKQPGGSDKLKENIKEYEKMYSDLASQNENLNMKVLQFSEELKAAKNEILKLNTEVENVRRDNIYLKQRNNEVCKNSLETSSHRFLPNSEARTQISNLLKQLSEEKSKVAHLKEELKQVKLRNGRASSPKLTTTEELNQYINNLNDMNVSLNMQNQRFSSVQSWVSLAEESLKESKIHAGVECNLMCELKELKSHLNQEGNVSREKQETLQELKQKFTTLLDDYKALQLKLKGINNGDANSEETREETSTLLSKLKTKDDELMSMEKECCSLKEEIGKLKLICEEVDVLKVQVQVYQTDFQEEREAREKLVSEKEEMAEQIRHLQSKISDLEQRCPSTQASHNTRKLCPRCCRFYSLSDYQEHKEEACLNDDCYT